MESTTKKRAEKKMKVTRAEDDHTHCTPTLSLPSQNDRVSPVVWPPERLHVPAFRPTVNSQLRPFLGCEGSKQAFPVRLSVCLHARVCLCAAGNQMRSLVASSSRASQSPASDGNPMLAPPPRLKMVSVLRPTKQPIPIANTIPLPAVVVMKAVVLLETS